MLKHGSIRRDISFFGRTLYDKQADATFFNWTGSGFEVLIEATKLEASFAAIDSVNLPAGALWPCISVFIDDRDEPAYELYLNQSASRYTLFESNTPERHRIRVVKRSENEKGKVGISSIAVEGAFLPLETGERRPKIEFIGDSITCGFGNEATTREGFFVPQEQNGLKSYCAIAAKLLQR